jgi:hypothetical protein
MEEMSDDDIRQNLRVGQRVVRIKKEDGPYNPAKVWRDILPGAVVGGIYTIRWIGEQDFLCGDDIRTLQAIRLVEITRTLRKTDGSLVEDFPYGASGFRPIVDVPQTKEVKTSIDIFHKIVQGVNDGKPIIPDKEKV